MFFVVLGVIGIILKYLEIGFVAQWNWWMVLSPFGMAIVWWTIIDLTGYTKRQAVKEEEARKKERIRRSREAMGLIPKASSQKSSQKRR
jgi:small Trp-rich protein